MGDRMQGGPERRSRALALAAVVVAILTSGCETKPLPIAIHTSEWSPYVTRDEAYRAPFSADGVYGEFADIVTETLREANYDPRFENRPWSVIVKGLREGRLRCAFPYKKDEVRDGFMSFSSVPLGVVREAIFYDNTRRLFGADGVLPGIRLGVIDGYSHSDRIGELFPSKVVLRVADEREAFDILVQRRPVGGRPIDALFCPEAVGEEILAQDHAALAARFAPVLGLGEDNVNHLVVPKGDGDGEALLARFDAAFERLRKRGVIDEIRAVHAARRRPESAAPQLRARTEVVLRAPPGQPIVLGYMSPRDEEAVAIPGGTRALVLEWARPFEVPGQIDWEDAERFRSRLRLLEGPLQGEIVWVPGIFMFLR